MGRQQKQTAEYFPHFVDEGRTKFILETRWGNNGYAFWYKLLEILCRSDGHYYDCSTATNKMYLCAYMKLDEQTVDEIMKILIDLGNIDKDLWEQDHVIWCDSLLKNLDSLYAKRVSPKPTKPPLKSQQKQDKRISDPKMGISETEKTITETETPISDTEKAGEEKVEENPKQVPEKKTKTRKKKEPEPEKVQYAEFVRMREQDYQKLVDDYGKEMVAEMIRVLDNYKGCHGKAYKDDYRAILTWVIDKVKKDFEKKKPQGGSNNYGGFDTDIDSSWQHFEKSTDLRKPDD